jgi:hypothetical protein
MDRRTDGLHRRERLEPPVASSSAGGYECAAAAADTPMYVGGIHTHVYA